MSSNSEAEEVSFEALPSRFSSLDAEKVSELGKAAVGSVAKLRSLLAARADVAENLCPGHEYYDGLTALHLAAAAGKLESAGLLLQAGASYAANYKIKEYEMEGAGPRAGQFYVTSCKSVTAEDVAASAEVRQMLADARLGYEPMLTVETLSIAVSGMDSTKTEFSMPSSATCHDLKVKVAETFQISVPQVCLISGTLPLGRSQESVSLGAKFSSKVKGERRIELSLMVRSVPDVLEIVQILRQGLGKASRAMREDKDVVMAAVQKNCWDFKYAAEELKADKDVALTAVREMGSLLQYVPEKLRGDKEVVLTACRNPRALQYASPSMKADKDCIIAAMQGFQDYDDLAKLCKEVPAAAMEDRDLAMAMVKKHNKLLSHLPDKLKDDKEVVLEAHRREGAYPCLTYASQRLKADWEVVATAIWSSIRNFYDADESLKSSKDFCAFLLQYEVPGLGLSLGGKNWQQDLVKTFKEEVRSDKELMRRFICKGNDTYDRSVMQTLPDKLKDEFTNDPELAMAAFTGGWEPYEFAIPSELLSNRDFIKEAMKKNLAVAYERSNLRNDREILQILFEDAKRLEGKRHPKTSIWYLAVAYQRAPEDLQANRELAMRLVKLSGDMYKFLIPAFKADMEFVNAALQDPSDTVDRKSIAEALPPELTSDKGFMLGVLKTDWLALGLREDTNANDIYLRVASSELLADKDFVIQALKLCRDPGYCLTEDRTTFWDKLSEGMKADKDVLMALLKKYRDLGSSAVNAYLTASEELKEDKDIYMLLPHQSGVYELLKDLPQKVRDDKDFMVALAGVESYLHNLADWEKWKHDRDVVRTMAKKDILSINKAGDALLQDQAFMLELMGDQEETHKKRTIFQAASKLLKADKGFLLQAVQRGYGDLADCPKELLADKELVLAVVKTGGCELENASEELRGDKDCATAAVEQNAFALQYVPEKLQRQLAIMAAGQDGRGVVTVRVLRDMKSLLLGDKEIALAAVKSSPDAFHFLNQEMKEDQDVFLAWDQALQSSKA